MRVKMTKEELVKRSKLWRKRYELRNPGYRNLVDARIRFGGLRESVLKRDNYCCVKCGMTDAEHRAKYGRSITIDHIDGNGRNSKTANNIMENLQTLCLPCHAKKDAAKLNITGISEIRERIKNGDTYTKVGKDYGVHRMTISRLIRGITWKHLL